MNVESIFWVTAVLIAPGLGVLAMFMAWLERRLTRQMVADDVETALGRARTPEELEDAIARSASALFRSPTV